MRFYSEIRDKTYWVCLDSEMYHDICGRMSKMCHANPWQRALEQEEWSYERRKNLIDGMAKDGETTVSACIAGGELLVFHSSLLVSMMCERR